MRQYIEAVEGVFPLSEAKGGILRDEKKVQGVTTYEIVLDSGSETKPSILISFLSSRGRDAAYAEIMDGIGRTALIKIAKYQDWTASRFN